MQSEGRRTAEPLVHSEGRDGSVCSLNSLQAVTKSYWRAREQNTSFFQPADLATSAMHDYRCLTCKMTWKL